MPPPPLRPAKSPSRSAYLFAGLVAGLHLGVGVTAVAAGDKDGLYRKLEILAQVLAHIENHYVDTPSATELAYGAAKGAASVLDEHSAFYSPSEYEALIDATEGEYAGIGVELGMTEELPRVLSVLSGSAAERAGIRAGDLIEQIDTTPTRGLKLEAVQQRLRGAVGSKVVVIIRRADRDAPWRFTLVRSWVRVAPLEHRALEDGLTYVHLKSFSRRVAKDLEALLARNGPTRGLVLDLRGNPGGLFDEAVAVCDLFLEDGLIVSAIGRGGRVLDRHEAHPRGTQPNYPMAILIDGGSASAAEVVAGALADRGRARLFGSRSYGKGSVQSIHELSDGSGLKLTVARYHTPNGRNIDQHGIDPDEVIEPSPDGDAPLLAASRWLRRQLDR